MPHEADQNDFTALLKSPCPTALPSPHPSRATSYVQRSISPIHPHNPNNRCPLVWFVILLQLAVICWAIVALLPAETYDRIFNIKFANRTI